MLEWTPDLSVNIARIDEQHKKLIDLLNELDAALQAGKPHEALAAKTIDYAAHHFATEEQLMDQYGFPGAAIHRSNHKQILAQARELNDRPDNVRAIAGLLGFLSQWIKEHITKCDKEYRQFLNDKGVR